MKRFIAILLIIFTICTLSSCLKDGLSAYDVAVENGFAGTVDEWLASLKGDRGDTGEKGDTGETGAPGSNGIDGINGKDGKDGVDGKDGKDGVDGKDGKDGDKGDKGDPGLDAPYIKDTYIDDNMHLHLVMSDGTVIDAGYVGPNLSAGSGAPELSEDEVCITIGTPYIIGCNLSGIFWESSDTSVLRVTDGGLILGISEGEAIVTATSHTGEKAQCRVEVSGYKYSIKSDGKVVIEGYSGTRSVLNIPRLINGKEVDEIGRWAFLMNEQITEVNFGDYVVTIGEGAFSSCDKLSSISFGTSLRTISDTAFSGCIALTEVVLPEGLTYLGSASFNACENLTSVKLPSTLTRIEDSTFNYCSSLKDIQLPKIEYIGSFAFHDCDGLGEITIPESVKELGEYAFADCSRLTNVVIENADLVIGDNAFLGTLCYQNDNGLVFFNVEKTMYAIEVYSVRSTPNKDNDNNIVGGLSIGSAVKVTGICYDSEENTTIGWARIIFQGEIRYVRLLCLVSTPPR